MPISTRNLTALPSVHGLRRLVRSLATLDAIMAPQWEDRYYSFDSKWAPGEELGSMRNGQGDQWFALFTEHGAVLHGLDHEAPMYRPGAPWPGIFDSLPPQFDDFRAEPAFDTANSTFCIWRPYADTRWSSGVSSFPPGPDPDGSEHLLSILDGVPVRYVEFAADYYEADVTRNSVEAVYLHRPLTPELVSSLNPEASLAQLEPDLQEIGYPLL